MDDAQEASGRTALMCASYEGHHECVDRFLQVGADKDAQDKKGRTALMSASNTGHHECVDCLLRWLARKKEDEVRFKTSKGEEVMSCLHP